MTFLANKYTRDKTYDQGSGGDEVRKSGKEHQQAIAGLVQHGIIMGLI